MCESSFFFSLPFLSFRPIYFKTVNFVFFANNIHINININLIIKNVNLLKMLRADTQFNEISHISFDIQRSDVVQIVKKKNNRKKKKHYGQQRPHNADTTTHNNVKPNCLNKIHINEVRISTRIRCYICGVIQIVYLWIKPLRKKNQKIK